MGMLKITLHGSFGNNESIFSAQDSSHAQAVREAINWLSGNVLEAAIRQDHKLQAENQYPTDRFELIGETKQ